MKVQDLFAKVGGIVTAFTIIIQIFFTHYLRYNFIMKLREHLNPPHALSDKIEATSHAAFSKLKKERDQCATTLNEEKSEQIDNSENRGALKLANLKLKKDSAIKNDIVENKSVKNIISIKNNFVTDQSNTINRLKSNSRGLNKITFNENNQVKDRETEDNISKVFGNSFEYEYVDFRTLSYLRFVYYKVFCKTSSCNTYDKIRNQIDELMDIYNFAENVKSTYSRCVHNKN